MRKATAQEKVKLERVICSCTTMEQFHSAMRYVVYMSRQRGDGEEHGRIAAKACFLTLRRLLPDCDVPIPTLAVSLLQETKREINTGKYD